MSCLLHKYNATLPLWSDLIAGQPISDSCASTQLIEPKTKQEQTSRPVDTKTGPCTCKHTRKYKHGGKKKKKVWCQSHGHVCADTSWVTRCCLQASASVLVSYSTAATEDKDSLHVVFTQPWRLLLVLCVWKWECEVAVRRHRPKIKRRSYLHTWHLLEFTLSFFPTAVHVYVCYPPSSGWDNCRATVLFLQEPNADFPQ